MVLLSREISLAAAALAYAVELNWAVFPLKPREKTPLTQTGFLEATTNVDQIAAWWEKWPDANIGIATGDASGIVVVDVDGPEGEAALRSFGPLPRTPIGLTGKGRHLVFARTFAIRNSAGKLGPKLDIRGDGGYIVVSPSVHPSGQRYSWDASAHPRTCELASLPEPIFNRLTVATLALVDDSSPFPPRPAASIHALATIGNGTRNSTLTEYAGRLFARGLGELEVLRLLTGMNDSQCRPPLDRLEVEAIVSSIGDAERRKRATGRRFEWLHEPAQPASLVRIDRAILERLGERNTQPIDAIPTMLPEWNDACRGFGGSTGLAKGWHITIGGASGTGKSLLALNLTASALRAGRPVLYVSLEMSRDQLLSRLLACASRRPVRELEPGRLYSVQSWNAAMSRFDELCATSGAWLAIADRPSSELSELVPMIRSGVEQGAHMIVLDYVQLVQSRGADGIAERVTQVSQAIQRVAFDLNVVTVALSQFNRATSFNKDAPPSPESLTGSSSLENDSDQVILLDHSANKRLGTRMETNVLVAKNRHGPVPSIPVVWDYTTLEIKQRTPDAMDRTEDRYGI